MVDTGEVPVAAQIERLTGGDKATPLLLMDHPIFDVDIMYEQWDETVGSRFYTESPIGETGITQEITVVSLNNAGREILEQFVEHTPHHMVVINLGLPDKDDSPPQHVALEIELNPLGRVVEASMFGCKSPDANLVRVSKERMKDWGFTVDFYSAGLGFSMDEDCASQISSSLAALA